jgi:tol-pal system protein YbgF
MNLRHLLFGGFAALMVLAAPAQAGLFGESDEEKAARIHEQNQDAAIADLKQRVQDLEDSLRQATGQNETLAHQVQQLGDKLERQKKDFEYRLCALNAQQLGANQGDGSEPGQSIQCPGGAPVAQTFNAPPPQLQPAGSPVVKLAPPPGVLGTLPAKSAPSNPQAQEQFNAALDLLAKAHNDEARAQFRSFADANPGDPLAPQAIYWVGQIDFLQKDYAGAAHAFVELLKKYPTSPRGADSMLKLGQSFIAMGQAKEGCMTLAALNTRYPNASKTIAAEAASERKTACR